MIKEITVTVALAALTAAGVYTKKGFDSTYLQVDRLEAMADAIYVRQDVYQQSQTQNRIWQLEDRIQAIKNNAARAGRPLTQGELEQIQQIQRDIARLR